LNAISVRQQLSVDRVGLRAPVAPRNSDRGRFDHMAFNSVCRKDTMDPEPVNPNFLNARDFHRGIHMPLGLGAKLAQQPKQLGSIAPGNEVPRDFARVRRKLCNEPSCAAQFEPKTVVASV